MRARQQAVARANQQRISSISSSFFVCFFAFFIFAFPKDRPSRPTASKRAEMSRDSQVVAVKRRMTPES